MPTRKSGHDTCKTSTTAAEPKLPKPMESEIAVQDPPESSMRVHATPEASSMERKNLLTTAELSKNEYENHFSYIEEYLTNALRELQKLHDTACETNAAKITMEPTLF